MGRGNRGGGRGGNRGGGNRGDGNNSRGGDRANQGNNRGGRNSNNSSKYCKNCKTNTHNTADCGAKGNSNQNTNINKVHKQGQQDQGSIYCKNCKKKGNHTTQDCRNGKGAKNKGDGKFEGKNKTITRGCSICQGWHKDSECTATTGKLPDGTPIVCRTCGLPHYNSQCPAKHGQALHSNANQNVNGLNTYRTPDGQILTMSGIVLRPCMFCNQSHLPQNCPQARVLSPAGLEGLPVPNMGAFPGQGGMGEEWVQRRAHYEVPNGFGGDWPRSNPPQFPSHNPSLSKWNDDLPPSPPREFSNESVHHNTLVSGNTAYHTHSPFHSHNLRRRSSTYSLLRQSVYGDVLGKGGREFHRALGHERDGDVKMSDVEECEECAFTDGQCVEHMDERARMMTRYGWEIRRRAEELRGLGVLDGEFRPLFRE